MSPRTPGLATFHTGMSGVEPSCEDISLEVELQQLCTYVYFRRNPRLVESIGRGEGSVRGCRRVAEVYGSETLMILGI